MKFGKLLNELTSETPPQSQALKQEEGQDGHEFAHTVITSTATELAKFMEFLQKKLEKYAKEIAQIKTPLPKELVDKFASSMLSRTTKSALRTKIMVAKMLEKEKGIKGDTELMQILSKGVITLEKLADLMNKAYPELDPDAIEEFVEKISTDPIIKDKIFNFNKKIERLGNILARTKFMSDAREKTPIQM
jgi:ABC-type Fe3+-citrate transport system substrate-binding protein